MIDMHTHLDLYPNALELASKTNKKNLFTLAVTTSPRAWAATRKVFSHFSNIEVALGLHPEIVIQKEQELDLLLSSIKDADFIGEIGLDGSHCYENSYEKQRKIFELAISECEKVGGRVISIHSRNAEKDVISILKKHPSHGVAILHWYSGPMKILEEAIQMGCFFSFSPTALLSSNGRNIVSHVPLNRIFPESDGPFCKINGVPVAPWESCNIAELLSEIHHVDKSTIISIFKDNLANLKIRK